MGTQTIYEADVIVVGFGAAGGCSAIEAHDAGAEVLIIEKQPQDAHYSNSRMSGGGYHSPRPDGDREALKAYARAMFSGENIGNHLDGEIHDFADDHAQLWADLAPDNDAFMRRLEPAIQFGGSRRGRLQAFPGAAESGYSVMRSTYSGNNDGWVGPGWGEQEYAGSVPYAVRTGEWRGIPCLHGHWPGDPQYPGPLWHSCALADPR